MPLSDTYKAWRDSTPVTPFPFVYKDRKEGKISQTWKEVHEKLGRDAVNLALPFSTAHIVPSTVQQNCIADMIKSEQRTLRRHQRRVSTAASTTSMATSISAGTNLAASQTDAQLAQALLQTAAAAAGSSSSLCSTSRPREKLYSAQERDALLSGEGGGRARRAFLKIRNHRPVADRFPIPKTSAQMVGWGLETAEGAFTRPPPPQFEVPDHRKKSCIKQMSRPSGVFERPEFF